MKAAPVDEIGGKILNEIQDEFPLCRRPFEAIGRSLGTGEAEVIERLAKAKASGVLRQVSAIFDTNALGYKSSLVAMRIPPDRLLQAARVINSHPGVSHNYKREHTFNLWLTVAVPPSGSIEWTVQRLVKLAGAESARLLPTVRLYKIGVSLDMTGERPIDARGEPEYSDERRQSAAAIPLTEFDIALVRALQEDLDLVPEPFAPVAEQVGLSQERLLEETRRLQRQGHLRRVAAIMRHRIAGYTANGMAVWAVPEDRIDEIGPLMASFRAVSHCYRRPTYPDWPYSVFTMIHARSRAECEATAAAIEAETGIHGRAMLYSTTEYKKMRLRYFSPELEGWEERERLKELEEARA